MIPLLAIFLVIASAFVHYEFLEHMNRWLPKLRIGPPRASVLLAVLGTFLSHFCQVLLFAGAYFGVQMLKGGEFDGQVEQASFGALLYFSAETYTSLGFGDIFPLGEMRLLVGIESITGLLMISWSASFTFLQMLRFWEGKDRLDR
ncbi:MAG: two pore domain potassium channel family protein [Verrucomicrobiae bacterium]|nr:two pore domain potassium channel family protein [Verrucomicrobiae bacterium]